MSSSFSIFNKYFYPPNCCKIIHTTLADFKSRILNKMRRLGGSPAQKDTFKAATGRRPSGCGSPMNPAAADSNCKT